MRRGRRFFRPPLGAAVYLEDLRPYGLHDRAPPWYYVLREAELVEDGLRLGPVARGS